MIGEGLFFAATVGLIAYGSAKREKSRRMFLDWVSETTAVVITVVPVSFFVDIPTLFERPSDYPITIVLVFVAVFIAAVLGRQIVRRMRSLNLPPLSLGLVFSVGTFALFNIVALYFYFKEPA